MADFAVHLPINSVSFGQVSINLLKEIKSRGLHPSIFPMGDVDLSAEEDDKDFQQWLKENVEKSLKEHRRSTPTIKLWHLNHEGLQSYSDKTILITFYELDSPTKQELNIASNHTTVVTSKYTQSVFQEAGAEAHYVPLGFDNHNFKDTNKSYFKDGRMVFNLCGKFEKRKRHEKVLKAWVKEFGNDTKYHLQCALYNKFMAPEHNNQALGQALEGKKYSNVSFLNWMAKNSLYNDFLNSSNIVIGMSGGEGWSLPEFHSIGLGKHGVILNAHVHKDWANSKNSVLVEPSEKIKAYDGGFFREGDEINQGNIFDFNEDDFISGCHEAIKRVEANKVNEDGLLIQEKFTYSKTLDQLLDLL
jgi:hypothetical protein